jgi:hypothetical protein
MGRMAVYTIFRRGNDQKIEVGTTDDSESAEKLARSLMKLWRAESLSKNQNRTAIHPVIGIRRPDQTRARKRHRSKWLYSTV